MPAAMRVFLAVPLSEGVRRALGRALEDLRRAGGDVKWVAPDNLHLTMRFLGEVEPERIERLRASLEPAISSHTPFHIAIRGVGWFPRGSPRPRVVWAGVEGDLGPLRRLWETVQAAVRSHGFPKDDHGFSPHVTIGRVRSHRRQADLLRALQAFESRDFGSQPVTHLALMRSNLLPEGAQYTSLATLALRSS